MSLHLLFVHGWAYDANLWGPVRSRLGDPPCTVWERGYFHEAGYFGEPSESAPPAPYLAVGHSFGVMRLLRDMPPGAVGLVSICGFARFSAADGFPGTPARVLDRMLTRFDSSPATVIGEFRARCGSPATKVYNFDAQRAREDLVALRDGDERAAAARLEIPILALSAGEDQIVSAAMTDSSFPQAERATQPGVGHLLPIRAPDWCARQIADFAARLAR